MADILDAANSQSDTPATQPNATVPPLPVTENPIMVPAAPAVETPIPDTQAKEDTSVLSHPLPDPPSPTPPKKKSGKGIVLTIILLLLVTLPLLVFYVSQQRQIADSRSRAGKIDDGMYAATTTPGAAIIRGTDCADGATECNDQKTLNVCSYGSWVGSNVPCSGDASSGFCEGKQSVCNKGTLDVCSNSDGKYYDSGITCGNTTYPTNDKNITINLPFVQAPLDVRLAGYYSCITDDIFRYDQNLSNAKKVCGDILSGGIQLPNISIRKDLIYGPQYNQLGTVQYAFCVGSHISAGNASPSQADYACSHYLAKAELPDIPIPNISVLPPGIKTDLQVVDYSACVARGIIEKDMNKTDAHNGCVSLLTDSNFAEGLDNPLYTGCVTSAIINGKTMTEANNSCQSVKNSGSTQPSYCDPQNEILCSKYGGHCVKNTQGGSCEGLPASSTPSLIALSTCNTCLQANGGDYDRCQSECASSLTSSITTPPVSQSAYVNTDCIDLMDAYCAHYGQSCQNNKCIGSRTTLVSQATPPAKPETSSDTTTHQSQPDQCDSGGQPHVYNECCASGFSRIINRSCIGGQFVWKDETGCVDKDGACLKSGETQPAQPANACPTGQVWYGGTCNDISTNGCVPQCKGLACGKPDGCSGVCTEKCATYPDAVKASNLGPTEGLVNKGKGINCKDGKCTKQTGDRLQICYCDALQNDGSLTAFCNQTCKDVSQDSADCQSLANSTCKVVQLDVYSSNNSLTDVTACVPDQGKCGETKITVPPPGGGGGGGGTGGGGGGGGTNSTNPPGTGTPPPPQCISIKIYKNGTVVTPSALVVGDQVQIAVAKNSSSKAKVRINGGAWSETTTLNSNNEYTVDWTVPQGLTNFTVESQIYVNGSWL